MKECVACKEPIQDGAGKCPHCHQAQGWLFAFTYTRLGGFLVSFIVLFVLGWVLFGLLLVLLNEEELSDQLRVGDGVLVIASGRNPPAVGCIARIVNTGGVRWGDFSFQARFSDDDGQVVDVHHSNSESRLYPFFSMEARVTGEANVELNRYGSCSLEVIDADAY